jgi:SulP family sulfate permease
VLNKAAGAQGRASGAVLGVLCLLALVWGGPVIALVPRPLLGGMLIYLGLGMLKAWLLDSRARLAQREYLTVLAMVAVTAVLGFLPAVCLGVLACCVDLAVSSAQLAPARRRITRAGWPSTVERPAAQADWLGAHGGGLHIVELQGVLFFGSTTRLAQQIDELLDAPSPPQRLLFDLRLVRWLDSSAAQSLARLFKAARGRGTTVELSAVSPANERMLRAAGALNDREPVRRVDIDAAVAAWDEALLAGVAATGEGTLEAGLAQQLGPALAARLLPAFETVELAAGAVLFSHGEASDALYLVRSGRLAVVVDDGEREVTVRTVLPGSAIGEMGLFRQRPRSATVRAEQATTLLRLSAERLADLESTQADAAAALYRLFVLQLASRVDQLTAQAHQLSR